MFETDRYWNAALVHDRILKTVQDIAIENSAGHHTKFVGIELNTTEQLKQCVDAVSSHPLLELDWALIGNEIEQFDDNSLEQIGAKKVKANLDDPDFKGHNEIKNYDYALADRVLSR